MLRRILAAFRAADRPLRPADLGRDLGIEEAALIGMLDTLVARGRICRLASEGPGCGGCPIRGGCFIMATETPPMYTLVREA